MNANVKACELAAEVVLLVGAKDHVLARKIRDLGAHVVRMSKEIESLRARENHLSRIVDDCAVYLED